MSRRSEQRNERSQPLARALRGLLAIACWAISSPCFPSTASLGHRMSAAPAAPTNLVVGAASRTSVDLYWDDNATDESEYRIEIRTLDSSFVEGYRAVDSGATIDSLSPDTIYLFRIRAVNAAGFSAYSNEAVGSTQSFPQVCQPGDLTLCLNNGRFKVRAHWQTRQGEQGVGHAATLTADTGTFWFFHPANVELVVKVLNGCALNRSYWIFAGGLTDVQVVLTVTDTLLGGVKAYLNPQTTAYRPLQDTSAFLNSCP
jgi:hypothetical protein